MKFKLIDDGNKLTISGINTELNILVTLEETLMYITINNEKKAFESGKTYTKNNFYFIILENMNTLIIFPNNLKYNWTRYNILYDADTKEKMKINGTISKFIR